MRKKIIDIIVDMYNVNREDLKPETLFDEDLGFELLELVELTMSAEDKFKIEITDDELSGIRTVNDFVELVEKKVKEV